MAYADLTAAIETAIAGLKEGVESRRELTVMVNRAKLGEQGILRLGCVTLVVHVTDSHVLRRLRRGCFDSDNRPLTVGYYDEFKSRANYDGLPIMFFP